MLFRLLKNEYYKIFKQKKIYIFLSIIGVMAFLPVLLNRIEETDIVFTVNTLPLENLSWSVELVIPIFIAILVGDLVTNEYKEGTLKLSLVSGATRIELLITKIIALISIILIMVSFTLIVSYLSGSIFLEWGVPFEFNNITLNEVQGIIYTLGLYLLSVVPLTGFMFLIIYLGFKLKSSGSVVGLTIGLFFTMNIIRQLSDFFRPIIIIEYFNTGYLLNNSELFDNLFIFLLVSTIYSVLFFSLCLIDIRQKDIIK